jgi:DNA repair protein RadC
MIHPASGMPGIAPAKPDETPQAGSRIDPDSPVARLRSVGPEALTLAELLAIVIDPRDQQGRTCASVARLMNEFTNTEGEPSLRALGRCTPAEITRRSGIGPHTAARIVAVMEMGRRAVEERLPPRMRIRTPDDVYAVMRLRLRDLQQEEFHLLVLNARCEAVRRARVAVGTLTCSLVEPREVFRAAIGHGAAAFILVQNHTCGDPSPSRADRTLSFRLFASASLLGLPLVDHVIIGDGARYSFREAGVLGENPFAESGGFPDPRLYSIPGLEDWDRSGSAAVVPPTAPTNAAELPHA